MSLVSTKNDANPNLYHKVVYDDSFILVLYVHNMFLTGAEWLIFRCKRELNSEFMVEDLGRMYYFLGLEV
jgi:hypothetical protein